MQRALEAHGARIITAMSVCRDPIGPLITQALDAMTEGRVTRILAERGYDALYHLFLLVSLDDGTQLRVEKNQRLSVRPAAEAPPDADTKCLELGFPAGLSFGTMWQNGRAYQEKTIGSEFTAYDSLANNCQVFVMAMVLGSFAYCLTCGGRDQLITFIKQDISDLFGPAVEKLVRGVISVARAADMIMQGGARPSSDVQSVMFARSAWSLPAARAKLRSMGFIEIKPPDVTARYLRFRQLDPAGFSRIRTKKITPDISLVIGFR